MKRPAWVVSASWGEGRTYPFYATAPTRRQAETWAQKARDAGAVEVSVRKEAS
mgnify:CR=1 FL=1